MPPVRSSDQPIEVRIERRQVALLGVAVLVLFGAVFSLGVLVGRQIASSSLAAPQQPPAGDLAALDAASRAPKAPKVVGPPPEPTDDAKAAELKAEAMKPAAEKADAAGEAEERKSEAPGNEAADDDEPAPKVEAKKPAPASEEKSPKEPRETPAGKFTVQLGASPDQKVALKLETKARAAGFDVHVRQVDLGAKGTWYRVRVGSFANRDDAVKVQQDAERRLRAPAMVVPAQ